LAERLPPEEIERFAHRLREREKQLLAELRANQEKVLATESFDQVAGEAPDVGDASLADLVTDSTNAERLRDAEELRDVQDALARVEAGTYGICLKCGSPIDIRRLEAFPSARYDLQHQAEQERARRAIPMPKL
jgi:RNA polymerase-binding transcription factor DksA